VRGPVPPRLIPIPVQLLLGHCGFLLIRSQLGMIGFGMGGELVLMGVLWIVGGERVLDMMWLVSLYLH
jgi:hypothetical protein